MTEQSEAQPVSNPYAPTTDIDPHAGSIVAVSALEVFAKVALAITILGSVAGVLASAWMLAFDFLPQSSSRNGELLPVALFFGGLVCGAVTVLFGISAVLVTPITMLTFGRFSALGGEGWDRQSITNFSRLSGFITGLVPTLILGRLGPTAIGYGSLVGLFFALTSPLLIPRLLRKADANLSDV